MQKQPAVFFDRDGTLIRKVHYLVKPEQVRLADGAAQTVCLMRQLGMLCVVVTNQSVIEHGLLDAAGLEAVHAELNKQLAAQGARLDAIYHCPRASIHGDPTKIEFPDRKPGPGMLLRAAAELGIDLGRSWMVGDSIADVLAGHHAGVRSSLWIGPPPHSLPAEMAGVRWHSVQDVWEAAGHVAATVEQER